MPHWQNSGRCIRHQRNASAHQRSAFAKWLFPFQVKKFAAYSSSLHSWSTPSCSGFRDRRSTAAVMDRIGHMSPYRFLSPRKTHNFKLALDPRPKTRGVLYASAARCATCSYQLVT